MRNLGLQEEQKAVKRQYQQRTMASNPFVVPGVMIGMLALLAGCPSPCLFSNDGECDDGRAGAVTDLCSLGTDPEDCGPVPTPQSSKCNPNQIDIVPKIGGSLTDLTWKVTTTCAGPLDGILCFEGGNESLCSANILDTPTSNSIRLTNLTSSFAADFLLPSGAEGIIFLYCDSATLSLTTPRTCSDGSAPQTKPVGRQESPCSEGTSLDSDTGECLTPEGCPADRPFLWSDGSCRASAEQPPPPLSGGSTITCENSIRIEIGPEDFCECSDLIPISDPATGALLFEPTLSCAVGTPDELITIILK